MNEKDVKLFSNDAGDDLELEPPTDTPQPALPPDEEDEEGEGLEMYPDEDVDPMEFDE